MDGSHRAVPPARPSVDDAGSARTPAGAHPWDFTSALTGREHPTQGVRIDVGDAPGQAGPVAIGFAVAGAGWRRIGLGAEEVAGHVRRPARSAHRAARRTGGRGQARPQGRPGAGDYDAYVLTRDEPVLLPDDTGRRA